MEHTRKPLQQPLFTVLDPQQAKAFCINPRCASNRTPYGAKERLDGTMPKSITPQENILHCRKCGMAYVIKRVRPENSSICQEHLAIRSIIQ